jgi:hypothetical protein
MRRFFTEMYARHLGKTLFFIAIGVSSSVGHHFMIKHFLDNELYAMITAVSWAALLVVIYSDGLANREYQYRLLTDSFNYHRTLRVDNRIGAIVPEVPKVEEPKVEPVVEEEKPVKPINKIEIVHSMEPMSKAKEAKA